ncbi:unnamed protein product [Chrysoparadoxa australica]
MDSPHVVIVGAGPGGCLTAINFAQRGWKTTLIERGRDFSQVDLTVNKSWMIGLSNKGIGAINRVPGLWEAIKPCTLENKGAIFNVGGKLMKTENPEKTQSYIVDRNYVTGALLKFLVKHHGSDPKLKCLFQTTLLYVDGQNKTITVRSPASPANELSYDLLIGADGVRSVVRNSLFSQHRDFACSNASLFGLSKSLYLDHQPEGYDPKYFYMMPGALKNLTAVALCGPQKTLNMAFGLPDHLPADKEILSSDPEVVFKYFRKNFKPWSVNMQFCREFCKARWYSIGQVKCNVYHMGVTDGTALLLGDAAHATSPALGMGMNTALWDAQVLDELMDELKESLEAVLPAYSEARVKEGRSLTDLSFNSYHVVPERNLWGLFKNFVRQFLNRITGGWVNRPGLMALGDEGRDAISNAFKLCSSQGTLDKNRAQNDAFIREHFERTVGMRPHTKTSLLAHQQRQALLGLGGTADIGTLKLTELKEFKQINKEEMKKAMPEPSE